MIRSLSRGLALTFLAVPVLMVGCIHSTKAKTESEANALPDTSGVQDPDPEKDPAGPQFCNPAGKQGDDLRKCNETNEAVNREFDVEAKKREPWFNFITDNWTSSKELDGKFVLPVVKEDEAVKKLEAAPLVELSTSEAQYFTGKAPAFAGMKPYLVRALMYFKDTGGFSVFEKDQAIYVRHDSVGGTTPSEKRSALVVYLGYKPKVVYVDCQVAE